MKDISGQYYKAFQNEFDSAFSTKEKSIELFNDLLEKSKGNTEKQFVNLLLFARSEQMFETILILSIFGLIQDGSIIARSLFELSIQLRYINKHNHHKRFLDYERDSDKIYYQLGKKHSFLEDSDNHKMINIQKSWSDIKLQDMAEDLGISGERELLVFKLSRYVHCDPSGLRFNYEELNGLGEFLATANPERLKTELPNLLFYSQYSYSIVVCCVAESFSITPPDMPLPEKYNTESAI
ncbi:MAG: hypothetical protein GF317_15315 [Candidatus Lokiarchaeota archaeon]|nr:hypothetical protein [Candidatus Lokiarchaeota archaeon]